MKREGIDVLRKLSLMLSKDSVKLSSTNIASKLALGETSHR